MHEHPSAAPSSRSSANDGAKFSSLPSAVQIPAARRALAGLDETDLTTLRRLASALKAQGRISRGAQVDGMAVRVDAVLQPSLLDNGAAPFTVNDAARLLAFAHHADALRRDVRRTAEKIWMLATGDERMPVTLDVAEVR